MALLARSMEYSDKDFDSLRLRLQNLVRSVFPEWTDFNVGSFGNILVELYAFVCDVLTFYQDAQARESRLLTATQRKNLIALCKLLGFRPAGARAATVDAIFSLAAPASAEVILPKGTRVSTASVTEPVVFQLIEELVFPPGATQATGTLEHSTPEEELFAASGFPNQDFTLPSFPFLDGSPEVLAGNGPYSEVQNFLGSMATDRHFIVVVDQNDRATLRFGNGVNGTIPTGTVRIRYKTGGGALGDLNAGTLTKLDGAFTDVHGEPLSISVTNPDPASGGTDRQSMAQIRVLAPESIRVLNRTVSREDFEINARRLPEIARALMLTSNEDAGIAENTGVLLVIPRGGGVPSQALKDAARHQVTVVYPCTLTFQVSVQDPVYLTVNVQATVFLRQGANAVAVRAGIQRALEDFFAISLPDGRPNPNVDFGWNLKDADGNPAGEIAFSDVFDVVRDVAGVRKIGDGPGDFLLNGADRSVPLGPQDFPVLGAVTLTNGATGARL